MPGLGDLPVASPAMPPTPDTSRPGWRFVFTGVLLVAMTAATLAPVSLGILAPFMRDDLGISRAQIGGLIAMNILTGAVLSPTAGHVTDRIGGRNAIALLFATAVAGFIGMALAPSYWWFVLPVVIAAVAQAGGNPATNKLIAIHTDPGRRGVVTGIKQSGVQAGVFVGGLTMPFLAEVWGWRWALAFALLVPLAGLVGTYAALPGDRPLVGETVPGAGVSRDRLPVAIIFLALYGALIGFGAAYTFLIPLFAEEALGLSEQAGGAAAAVVGFTALFARIGWARYADIGARHALTLVILAFGSVAAVVALLGAQSGATWLLWAGAALTGLSSSSWNSVGMLAVIDYAGRERSGRASGVVMLGFLTGLGLAPTLFGWLVDRTDSYTPMWLISIGVLGAAATLSLWWLRSPLRTGRGRRVG